MLTGIIILTGLAAFLGAILGFTAIRFRVQQDPVVDQIDALLPQTQCAHCGYPGCRPYAEAIAAGNADINQCPPGGVTTIKALANLLGRDPKPLNLEYGSETLPALAVIDESTCIGCTLCIQACPVDAIIGAAKQMHTIIAPECTGCELCVPACPVDCIDMLAIEPNIHTWKWGTADTFDYAQRSPDV